MAELLFQDLDVADFLSGDCNENFGLADAVFWQLYRFYKGHTQRAIYFVDANDAGHFEDFDMSAVNRYYEYGIRFKSSSGVLSTKRSYLLIVPESAMVSEQTLVGHIKKQKSVLGDVFFKACVIEKDYSSIEEFQVTQDRLLLAKVLPDTFICNFNEIVSAPEDYVRSERNPSCDYIDVAELFSKFNCFGVDFKNNLLSIQKIVDSILELCNETKGNVVFFLSKGDDSTLKTFTGIAAFLTVTQHLHFEIPNSYLQLFLFNLRNFHSRKFNYISDFLKDLVQPLEIAATFQERRAYLCSLNFKRLAEKERTLDYQIFLNVVGAPFDLRKLKVTGSCANHTYSLNRIEVLDIQKLFGLAEDNLDNLFRLNTLVETFETSVLRFLNHSSEVLLNSSNLLLYRFCGQEYLGFVSFVGGRLPYIFYPVSNGYTSFEVELSIEEYQNLYDVAIFNESDAIIQSFVKNKRILGEKVHYCRCHHFRGALFSFLPTQPVKLDLTCGFSLEELGIWSTQTASLRDDKEIQVMHLLEQDVLRQKKIATFYGGPHPFVSVDFNIENNLWR